MAVDEALFESLGIPGAIPVLRIYGWQPPGVSVGYFQSLEKGINLDAIHERGYGLVRRPTGGRAIIHHHEVTYSVCTRADYLADGNSVLKSYREISTGIEAGLALLDIGAHVPRGHGGPAVKGKDLPSVCFAKALGGDMTVQGRKIVGSAQMRRAGCILQHGSIPITIDLDEHVSILGEPDANEQDARQALASCAVGVADVVGRPVSFDELAQCIASGFERAMGTTLEPGDLTPLEKQRAAELAQSKYGDEQWTMTPGRRDRR